MSGGHDDHGDSKGSSGSEVSGPSTMRGVAGTMTGMFGFLFTGMFDDGGGGDHGHH